MKLKFENLGVIKSGEIDLSKELIILTGGNNTGKSYVSYLLYGLYGNLHTDIKNKLFEYIFSFIEVEDNFPIIESKINLNKHLSDVISKTIDFYEINLTQKLYSLYASKKVSPSVSLLISEENKKEVIKKIVSLNINENFNDKKIEFDIKKGIAKYKSDLGKNYHKKLAITISKEFIIQMLLKILHEHLSFFGSQYSLNSYLKFFPAERSSINLFSHYILLNKAKKFDEISLMSEDERKKLKLNLIYPLPINDYLYFINELKDNQEYESEYSYIADEIERLIEGKLSLNEFDEIVFKPTKSDKQLDLHISSSTVKSLAGLVFYFRYYAMKDDVIFIDEPELNLHPDNQRNIARIIAKAINGGIKVILSTHSDYIIRELNNLIMLNQKSEVAKELMLKYKYNQDELLKYEKIGAYLFKNNSVKEIPVDDVGFEVETIDKEINKLNETAQDIYFSLFD